MTPYRRRHEQITTLLSRHDAYLIKVPLQRKDLTLIPSKHRARARRKRAFRDAVKDAAQHALTPYLTGTRI